VRGEVSARVMARVMASMAASAVSVPCRIALVKWLASRPLCQAKHEVTLTGVPLKALGQEPWQRMRRVSFRMLFSAQAMSSARCFLSSPRGMLGQMCKPHIDKDFFPVNLSILSAPPLRQVYAWRR
jgi:hypothetical protein